MKLINQKTLICFPANRIPKGILNQSKRLLFLSCFILQFCSMVGQYPQPGFQMPEFTPVTPSAAELAKAITFPVSLNTGLVDIKIPLYEIQCGDIILPIYLTYHGSGIKVQEPHSWVGAGWTLVAEPKISRVVEGLPDEGSAGLNHLDLCEPYHMNGEQIFNWLNDDVVDKLPDRYFYQLVDDNGGFYFDRKSIGYFAPVDSIVVHPYKPIKIQKLTTSAEFKVSDNKGLIYLFGDINGREDVHSVGGRIISCWKASSIESTQTNAKINFSYYPYHESENPYHKDYITISYCQGLYQTKIATIYDSYSGKKYCIHNGGIKDSTNECISSDDLFLPENGTKDRYSSYVFTECLLSCIYFDDFQINFNIEKQANRYYLLKSIEIVKYNLTGTVPYPQIIKRIDFKLSQLGRSPNVSVFAGKVKYKLDAVEILPGGDPTKIEKYQFTYYDPDQFPAIDSRSIDYWGYYNGEDMNSFSTTNKNMDVSLVPLQGFALEHHNHPTTGTIPIVIGGANRRSSDNIKGFTKIGSLKEIIYPTGGKTTFDYELHKYKYNYKFLYEDVTYGGGLRIREIKEQADPNIPAVVRKFEYSNGLCKFPPIRYHDQDDAALPDFFVQKQEKYTWMCYYDILMKMDKCEYKNSFLTHIYSTPLMDFNTANGSPVVYTKITEYSGNDSTKTEYFYEYSYESENTPFNFKLNARNDWMEGNLKSIVEYKKSNLTYQKIREKNFKYIVYNEKTTPAFINEKNVTYSEKNYFKYCNTSNRTEHGYLINNIISGCCLLQIQTENLYNDNQQIVSTTINYDYNDIGSSRRKTLSAQPKTIETIIEKKWETGEEYSGEAIREEFFYPHNLTLTGSVEEGRAKLVELGAVTTLLKKNVFMGTRDYYFSDDQGDWIDRFTGSMVNSTQFDYKLFTNHAFPQLAAINDGREETSRRLRVELQNYNKYGKPMLVKKPGEPDVVLLWAYQGQYLIGEIKNATVSQVMTALGGESAFNTICDKTSPSVSDWSTIDDIRKKLPSAMVDTYQYDKFIGMTSHTDPQYIRTTYTYDLANRLQYIKDNYGYILESYMYHYQNQ